MSLSNHQPLLDQLRECGRLFHQRGWSVGTSSNYSVILSNDPVELIVTASGKDKGRLEADDFVHIGADGQPYWAWSGADTAINVGGTDEPLAVGAWVHEEMSWTVSAHGATGEVLALSAPAQLQP